MIKQKTNALVMNLN